MRRQITLFQDQYELYKELKSEKLLIAFVEFMFEDKQPKNSQLNSLETAIFNSFVDRMEKSKKLYDRNSKGGQNSNGGGRPKTPVEKPTEKTAKKQPTKQPNKQPKNKEEEVEVYNILSYDNIYSNYYGKNKGIDEKVCNKLIDAKLEQGITLDDINKSMVLYNCHCRLKQDYTYVKKFENWIKEFQKPTDEQLEENLYVIIKEFRDKKKSDDKFGNSSPARTIRNDLKQTFGEEKVKGLRKQANSIQLNFT